jgi:hypothetical protein
MFIGRGITMREITPEQALEEGKGLTFEKVWVAMMENRKLLEKAERIVAEVAEEHKKTERIVRENAESLKKLEKTVDRVCGNAGGLNRSMGELIESLIAARLWEKFPQYGLKRAYQRIPLYNEKGEAKSDIDILLVDTETCMAIEVKREQNRMDEVDRHVKRMQLIRQYPPADVVGKQLLGAMAGAVVDPEVKNYAYKCGFYVLELSGEAVQLIPQPEGFVPQKW